MNDTNPTHIRLAVYRRRKPNSLLHFTRGLNSVQSFMVICYLCLTKYMNTKKNVINFTLSSDLFFLKKNLEHLFHLMEQVLEHMFHKLLTLFQTTFINVTLSSDLYLFQKKHSETVV